MNGSDGVGVGGTWQQRQWRLQHQHQQPQGYGGGYGQPYGQQGYVPPVEQQYQQQLYPGGWQQGANVPDYQYGGYGPPPQQPYIPPPVAQRPCPPGQAIYGGAGVCRPLPPLVQGQQGPVTPQQATMSPTSLNSWARWQQVHPGSPYSAYQGWWSQYGQGGGTINGLPHEVGVGQEVGGGAMSVGVGYPDHYHVGYDSNRSPIYQDRYGRHHYGHQTGYQPAPAPYDPSQYDPSQQQQYGLSQAPTDAPPGAPPGMAPAGAAPIVVVPPAAAATPVVVVQHPNGAVTPWYGGVAAQLRLPH